MVFRLFLPHMSSVLKSQHKDHGWSWHPSKANEFPNAGRTQHFLEVNFCCYKNTGCSREGHNYTPVIRCMRDVRWFIPSILRKKTAVFWHARSICPELMQFGLTNMSSIVLVKSDLPTFWCLVLATLRMQAAANSGAVPTMEFRGVVVEGGVVLRQWRCRGGLAAQFFPTIVDVVVDSSLRFSSIWCPTWCLVLKGCYEIVAPSEKMITKCEKYI